MSSAYFLLLLPGFWVGLFVWSRMNQLFLVAVGLKYDMSLPPPSDEDTLMRWFLLFLVTLVAVYLILFGGLAYYFRQVGSPGWSWFFLGAAATPCLMVPAVLWARRLHKRRAATNPGADA
jgi:hypothetical protein